MALNGRIQIFIVDGRIKMETSLDPVLVALVCEKVSIKLLEEQVMKKGSILEIGGLMM